MTWLIDILKIELKKAVCDKTLREKAFNNAKNPKYDGYQRSLVSMVYNFFDIKTESGAAIFARSETLVPQKKFSIKNENVSNKELHKPNISKFKNKMYSSFMDNIRVLILLI